jgi:hypothetical protein
MLDQHLRQIVNDGNLDYFFYSANNNAISWDFLYDFHPIFHENFVYHQTWVVKIDHFFYRDLA